MIDVDNNIHEFSLIIKDEQPDDKLTEVVYNSINKVLNKDDSLTVTKGFSKDGVGFNITVMTNNELILIDMERMLSVSIRNFELTRLC